MDLRLQGKKALITGSTAGIGLATAAALAGEGAAVVVNGRTEARVAAAVAKIREHAKGCVSGIAADAGSRAGADQILAGVADVDILVNNLGIFEPKAFEEIPDADWRRFFEVNVLGGCGWRALYLPGTMVARTGDACLFISSESGLQIPAEMIHYGMTKTPRLAVTRGLAEMPAPERA